MESKANKMILINYIALFLMLVGIFLDLLTIIWEYQAARGKNYRSGNFLVPAILYIMSIIIADVDIDKLIIIFLLILMHFFIYFVLGWILDIIYKKSIP